MHKVAQALARHSDINLTLGVYTDLDMDELHEAIGKLDAIIQSEDQPPEAEGAQTSNSQR